MSKLRASLAAAYSAATAVMLCSNSTSRPVQRRKWPLIRERAVNGAGQTLLRDRSKITPRAVAPLLASQISFLASSVPSHSWLA